MLLKTTRARQKTWKTFKYSSIKKAIFEQAQEASNLKPLKVLKACTTRWLTHGESCAGIISRFQPLIDALGVIFFESGDAEAKQVRDLFLEPNLLLLLLLASFKSTQYIVKVSSNEHSSVHLDHRKG